MEKCGILWSRTVEYCGIHHVCKSFLFRSQLQFKTDRTYIYVQERSFMRRNVALRARVHAVVVVVDTIMLGAWPKMPTSTFSQSRGRISSQQKFSVVDL